MGSVTDSDELFGTYARGAAWDEMLDEGGDPRPPYKPIHHTLRAMNPEGLKERADALANRGVESLRAGQDRGGRLSDHAEDAAPEGHTHS